MRRRSPPVPILVLAAAVAVAGCGSGGSPTDPGSDGGSDAPSGDVSLTVARAAASSVPSQADSAYVRIWHPSAGTDNLEKIPIPDPDSTTTLSFTVPARDGYSVGVIAYVGGVNVGEAGTGDMIAVAGGRTDGVSVAAGDTTQVALDVVPWEFSWSADRDTLVGDGAVTFTVDVTQGPSSFAFLRNMSVLLSLEPWGSDGAVSDNDSSSVNQLFTGAPFPADATIQVPSVSSDTTAWIQFAVRINFESWGGSPPTVFDPALVLGETLATMPVKPPEGGVTVTFDREGEEP